MKSGILIVLIMFSIQYVSFAQKGSDEHYEKGFEAYQQHDYDEAIDHFSRVIAMSPDHFDAYLYRAHSRVQTDDYQGAFTDFRIYLGAFPEDIQAVFSYSVVCYQLKRYAEAEEGFLAVREMPRGETTMVFFRAPASGTGVNKVLTAQGTDLSYLYNYLGLTYHGLEQYDRAIAYYDSALRNHPQDADVLVNKALSYSEKGNDKKAIEIIQNVLEFAPDHSLGKYNLAILKERSGDFKETDVYFSESIKDNPQSPYGYRQRGYRRLINNQFDKAVQDFTMAIKLKPEDAESWLNRAIAYDKMGKYENAYRDYSQTIELEPSFAKAYLNRGNLSLKLKQYNDAINDYNVAIIYDHEYGVAFYQRGVAYHSLGQDAQACSDLDKAVALKTEAAIKAREKICVREQ